MERSEGFITNELESMIQDYADLWHLYLHDNLLQPPNLFKAAQEIKEFLREHPKVRTFKVITLAEFSKNSHTILANILNEPVQVVDEQGRVIMNVDGEKGLPSGV